MTKQTWTPGPWRNRQTRNGSWRIEGPRLASSARKLVPIVLADILKHSQLPADEPAANARLIALAPEMVEALYTLDIVSGPASGAPCYITQEQTDAIFQARMKARAILAKLESAT